MPSEMDLTLGQWWQGRDDTDDNDDTVKDVPTKGVPANVSASYPKLSYRLF